MKPRSALLLVLACAAIVLPVGCGDETSPTAPPGGSSSGGSPTISSIQPPGASPGIQIVIAGSDFGSVAGSVLVGAKDAAIDAWTTSEIKCTLPAGITEGLGAGVTVKTASGESAASQMNITPPHTYQVTSGHPMDHYPCWSGGGTYIYYSSVTPGTTNWDIYRILSTGGTPERITRDEATDFYPHCNFSSGEIAWSSTMRHINNTELDFEIFYGYPACLVPGSACVVTMLTSNVSRDLHPAYARTVYAGYSMTYTWEEVDGNGHFLAWNVMLSGVGPPVKLTEGRQSRFSPNGRQVVYTYQDNVYTIPTDGGAPVQLTSSNSDWYPDWGPDGRIVFQRSNGGNFEDIMVMNSDGTGVEPLVSTRNNEYCPSWSPDGKRVAYYALVVGNYDIYVYVMP